MSKIEKRERRLAVKAYGSIAKMHNAWLSKHPNCTWEEQAAYLLGVADVVWLLGRATPDTVRPMLIGLCEEVRRLAEDTKSVVEEKVRVRLDG